MIDSSTIERFAKESPTSMMVQGLMEHLLAPETLDTLFEGHAKVQYTRNLLFSQVVNLMSLVVCGIQPSVNAAYRRQAKELNVSRTALYNKLNGIESEVSAHRSLIFSSGSGSNRLKGLPSQEFSEKTHPILVRSKVLSSINRLLYIH